MPVPRPLSQKTCSKRCRNTADNRRTYAVMKESTKIARRMSQLITTILRRGNKIPESYVLKYVKCSMEEVRAHFERQFTPDMHWGNYGVFGWQIDHIIPCERFNLELEEHKHVCFDLRNMRPLWWRKNCVRQDVMSPEDMALLDPELRDAAIALGIKF